MWEKDSQIISRVPHGTKIENAEPPRPRPPDPITEREILIRIAEKLGVELG